MQPIEINWTPTDRQLRQFGFVCPFALPLIVWLFGGGWMIGLAAATGLSLAVAGVARPRTLKPVFVALSAIAAPIGIVVGELAMLLIYFGVFLPMGLVFRAMKRDSLELKFNGRADTYWKTKKRPSGAAGYFRRS